MKTSLTACILLLSAALAAPAGADTLPVSAPIVIDGDFRDWAEVRTNPTNTALDGEGSGDNCTFSTDLDCRFGEKELDLAELSWTWDAEALYVFGRLLREHGGGRHVYLYFDTDHDGFMESGEPLFRYRIRNDDGETELERDVYVAAGITGRDPMTSLDGKADGHDLPGTRLNTPVLLELDRGMTATLPLFEIAIPWTELGVEPGAPLGFHVSATKGTNLPGDVKDNMAGPSGGPGTTGFRSLHLEAGRTVSNIPGSTIELRHLIRNEGNLPALVNLRVQSQGGHSLTLRKDADGDGFAETLLAIDVNGDGAFSVPGDTLFAGGDQNADGRLDVGVLERGAGTELVIEQESPLGSGGVSELLEVTVSQAEAPAVSASVTDIILIGDLTLPTDQHRLATPGDFAWFPHVVQNNSTSTEKVDLDAISALGWSYDFHEDPDGDGDPAGALPLVDTDASGLPDLTLQAGASVSIFARAEVPASASPGPGDLAAVRVVQGGTPMGWVSDRSTIIEPLRLEPSYLFAEGDARYGAAGGPVYFSHRLTNARGLPDDFDLVAVSDLGWSTSILSDPDGDGRPYDSSVLPGRSPIVAGNGGFVPFIVRVLTPPMTAPGETTRVTVTAVSRSDSSVSGFVEDDAVVAIVRVYEDEGHVVNVRQAAPCGTVYAQADNLPASQAGYRFVWRNAAGDAVRVQDTVTDATGACADEMTLQPSDLGSGWRVEIEQFVVDAFVTLDTALFDVAEELVLGPLTMAEPALHLEGDSVVASFTTTNESFDQVAEDVQLRWVVLSPDRASYLHPAGLFLPYSETDATRIDVVTLRPRDQIDVRLFVADVLHETAGTFPVEVWRVSGCGETYRAAESSYEVLDDEDDDGLTRAVELAAGTDPQDADTDDDGLLDDEDGLADSDGDGLIDALDCDADDDGLTDGLEAGVWLAHADTDPSAGCFVADLWPASTTDPRDPDTDDGGVPDGVEDANGNGRLDPGEGDPLDAADDGAQCAAERPLEVTGLLLHHQGSATMLSWTELPTDACTSYVVLSSAELPDFEELAGGLIAGGHVDEAPLESQAVRFYLIRADSLVSGAGPTGR